MGENSNISWTAHTFNAWEGCAKVSPGCANCYAEALNHRWGKDNWGKGKPRRRTSEANWKKPLKWNADASLWLSLGGTRFRGLPPSGIDPRTCQEYPDGNAIPPRVFSASMSDWLD